MKFYEKGKDFISERRKRWISLIMVAVMIVTLVPFVPCSEKTTVYAALSAYNRLNRNVAMTGNAAVDIVNIACAQANRTGDDLGYSIEWCAQFVIDCARAAGCSQYIGNSPGVPTFYSQVLGKGGKVVSYSQVKAGDLAFTGNLGHVEIVHNVIGGKIYTVGGNTGSLNLHNAKVTVRDDRNRRNDLVKFLRPAYGNTTVVEAVSNPDAHSVPTQNLYRGSRGDSVSWVQSICNRLLGSSLDVDGQYGSDTVNAVKAFQRKYGLAADGIVGPQTRNKMIEAWNATKVVNASYISISSTNMNLTIGYNEQLSTSIEPSNTTDKSIRWSSSNSSVATVNNGVVSGVNEGTADITASTVNGKTATCKVHVYKEKVIRFLDYDGSVLSQQKLKYGSSATAPENPQRTGYTFKGWDGTYQNVTKDADIQAIYSKNVYNVTFMETNGIKIGDTQRIEYQESATAPDESMLSIPDGYVFEGWSETFDCITSDMTIYPVYKWADEELPLVVSADENSCISNTDEGTYTLNFTISKSL